MFPVVVRSTGERLNISWQKWRCASKSRLRGFITADRLCVLGHKIVPKGRLPSGRRPQAGAEACKILGCIGMWFGTWQSNMVWMMHWVCVVLCGADLWCWRLLRSNDVLGRGKVLSVDKRPR